MNGSAAPPLDTDTNGPSIVQDIIAADVAEEQMEKREEPKQFKSASLFNQTFVRIPTARLDGFR
jgi:hypothetical protein